MSPNDLFWKRREVQRHTLTGVRMWPMGFSRRPGSTFDESESSARSGKNPSTAGWGENGPSSCVTERYPLGLLVRQSPGAFRS